MWTARMTGNPQPADTCVRALTAAAADGKAFRRFTILSWRQPWGRDHWWEKSCANSPQRLLCSRAFRSRGNRWRQPETVAWPGMKGGGHRRWAALAAALRSPAGPQPDPPPQRVLLKPWPKSHWGSGARTGLFLLEMPAGWRFPPRAGIYGVPLTTPHRAAHSECGGVHARKAGCEQGMRDTGRESGVWAGNAGYQPGMGQECGIWAGNAGYGPGMRDTGRESGAWAGMRHESRECGPGSRGRRDTASRGGLPAPLPARSRLRSRLSPGLFPALTWLSPGPAPRPSPGSLSAPLPAPRHGESESARGAQRE